MFPETLYSDTKSVLENLSRLPFLGGFYLAGGTALALQLGHRKSVDLDFFIQNFPDRENIFESIKELKPEVVQEDKRTLNLEIGGVKVSFIEYQYPVLDPFVLFDKLNLASVLDIACMKITAISSRGAKKDFIDIYEILKRYSLTSLFDAFNKKYVDVSYQKAHLLKSLIYFIDAEGDPEPDLLVPTSWEKVKEKIQEEVGKIALV